MSNKDYYMRWLEIKREINAALIEDACLQHRAKKYIGVKPQANAVEVVGRTYCRYCRLYNTLCDVYDQMEQVQRRFFIKTIIDALSCRILELKSTLQEVEAFEFTYPDNAMQQLLMVPEDIQLLTPYFYGFESREQEMQYIIDEIFAGNRLGDPEPTPSELERLKKAKIEEEQKLKKEREEEIENILMSDAEELEARKNKPELSPEELAQQNFIRIYNDHLWNIQRMERSRNITRQRNRKFNKDTELYLELSGLKKPVAPESLRIRASLLIKQTCRQFMKFKRDNCTEIERQKLLGMIMPSWSPQSVRSEIDKVKRIRREFRKKYFQKWLNQHIVEKSRILRLREGDIMEDISDEIRQWFREWYDEVRLFDEYPWPEEGGSILIVKGETFTIPEFIEWRDAEKKQLNANKANPKSKEQQKAEKAKALEEKKRLELDAKVKEKLRLENHKKQRANPFSDPGVYITIGKHFDALQNAWKIYQNQWKDIDDPYAPLDVMRGFIKELITEEAYKEVHLELRPIVDEMMRVELQLLKDSLKIDCRQAGLTNIPQSKKRPKPRIAPVRPSQTNAIPPERMFQKLVDEGIIRKYPHIMLDDYWGDRNYAAADMRGTRWTPSFPPPTLGDVREQVRVRVLLTSGCSCQNANRSQLLVGPKGSGKRTLVYAIATETNSILIDLSPMNVYNKFRGSGLKTLLKYVNQISRIMQPTVILVDNADKLFYKAVPKEDRWFKPKRLTKRFFKDIVKPISPTDKIMVLGTATQPWLANRHSLSKAFPTLILIPRSDFGSICVVLRNMLMKYHGVSRQFNVQSTAQVLRGYSVSSIIRAIDSVMNADRIIQLYFKPLQPAEILEYLLAHDEEKCVESYDYQMFEDWYMKYSSWGFKFLDLKNIIEKQLIFKLKMDKRNAQ